MAPLPTPLELPIEEAPNGDLAGKRLEHLARVAGVDRAGLLRLTRAFPSLSAIYGASEEVLTKVVGPVASARIRWFLDAPLDTALAPPSFPDAAHAA